MTRNALASSLALVQSLVLLLLLSPMFSTAVAQNSAVPEAGGLIIPASPVIPPATNVAPSENSVFKPVLDVQPSADSALKPVVSASAEKLVYGMTYVALSPGLKPLSDGKEPSSLEELRELEKQQSQVAKMIQQVTVNIQQGAAQGSGVIINSDGYILTAAHVAGSPGRDATVILHDGTRLKAKTLGMNRDHDAGLVKIEDASRKFPHATVGESTELKIGQWVVGAGHPGGWQANRGTVIRVGRVQKTVPRNRDPHTLFTDCALIGGDSGGPLFTLDGKLIGIHSRIGTEVTDNMHVPINVFRDSWDRMASKREAWGVLPGYGPPFIGVKGKDDGPAIISEVEVDGPADMAGILKGDRVIRVENKEIITFEDLRNAIKATAPGDVVTIVLERENHQMKLPVQIGTLKPKGK
jgi:serine protease Do